ncbi:MAG: ABC transporter ATP-binding protein [Deltaproteobacteria bacterium]|nr:ABC transporter ATP-binding protein [Deltaproteobacteria bacterium]
MKDLVLTEIHLHYGAVHALHGISIEVEQGAIVTLIGANGAGKTSTANAVIGLRKVSSGKIIYRGNDITNMPAHRVNRMGIALVPEGRQLFPLLTVEENLLMGAYSRKDRDNVRQDLQRMFKIFPVLSERKRQLAQSMSGGEQQMLAIARALMVRPKFLILDEPSLGLAPLIVKDIFNIIHQINQEGTTILLIEQNANLALATADYAYVLDMGSIVREGKPAILRSDPAIKEAYLGT